MPGQDLSLKGINNLLVPFLVTYYGEFDVVKDAIKQVIINFVRQYLVLVYITALWTVSYKVWYTMPTSYKPLL